MAQLGFWGFCQGFGVLGAGILEGLAAWGLGFMAFGCFGIWAEERWRPFAKADATPPEP